MNIEQGTLKDTSAAELLLTGFSDELSGVLYLKREDILKELYLNKGKLVWAISNSEVDTIENMLISENKVDRQTISVLRGEVKNSLELGKLLVEKGLITFEELIEFSKKQLRKILLSILKWSDGVFYFSKDVPPETFMSLEVDLDKFVKNFIREDLDMGFIWTRIGSLHEEFVKVSDDKKIEKFDLTKEELELLDKFSGDLNIEIISLNFPGMPKEDILKTIYYFMMGGLLDPKGEKPSPQVSGSTFVENSILTSDSNEPVGESPGSNIELDTDLPVKSKSTEDVLFSFADEKKALPETKPRAGAEKFSVANKSDKKEVSMTDKMLKEMKKEEGKKRIKLINIMMILIVVIFIVAGLIFIMLSPEKKGTGITPKDQTTKVETTDKQSIIDSKQQKSENLENKAIVDMKKVENQGLKKVKKKDQKVKPETKDSAKKILKKKSALLIDPVRKDNPLKIFSRGDMKRAGDLWKEEIKHNNISYSILLELDCMKDSVRYAFKQINDKKQFFILNRVRGNRTCYLVFFGKYRSKSEAEGSVNTVPKYFWNQTNPPKVLELKDYL